MYFEAEKYEGFQKYIFEIIGKSIKPQTIELYRYVRYHEFHSKYLDKVKKLIYKNKMDNIYIKESQLEDYIYLEYFAEYYEDNLQLKSKYNNFEKKLKEYSIFNGDVDIFNFQIETKEELICHRYYIFHNDDINQIKDILDFLKIKCEEYKRINVIQEEYEISGLTLIRITEKTPINKDDLNIKEVSNIKNKNCLLQKFNNHLWDARIGFCYYDDFQSKVNFSCFLSDRKINRRQAKIFFRKDLKKAFKSTYEANIARILNYKNISWEYENKEIPFETDKGILRYLPDFIITHDTIIEVKGFWDNQSLKMMYLFNKQYSNYTLLIIDSDMMFNLDKMYSSILNNWEKMKLCNYNEVVPIVGVNQPERRPVVDKLIKSEPLFLIREPDNLYDKNAIKTVNANGELVGYVAKEWAVIYAQKIDLGMEYESEIARIESKRIELKIKRKNHQQNIVHNILRY